ncbi:hypothetical protein HUJ05_004358 [Dendroctonus ponderosae]|nr:hypothetical protein HUJ05_004358 [Dendroctonus ponderosae]
MRAGKLKRHLETIHSEYVDICDQLVFQTGTSKFAIQVDEANHVAKVAHLTAYIRYVNHTNIIEDILFCKPIPDRATSN